jgi:HK97 family phage prohead protease
MTIDVRERLEGTVERRTFDASLETRDIGDGATGFHLTGYATVFATPYNVGGENGFTETISRGALKRSLGENPDVQLLQNHEGMPLARTKSGTLTLTEDARGLKVDAELDPSDPDVQALAPKLRRGDVDSMSISFRATGQKWSADRTERTITAMSVHRGDVSVVARPASESTSVALRHAGGGKKAPPVRSYLETAKAKRAKLRHKATSTHAELVARGYQDQAKARQLQGRSGSRRARTQADVDRLGKAGMAWKRRDGLGYSFPCENEADVKSAVLAVNRARPAERPGIRKFIMRRAKALGCADLIPPAWEASGALQSDPGPRPGAYS